MLQGIFFFLHLVISFLIVVVVLLQRSKGGGLSGAFGGVGAGDASFGNVGVTTFLHKATIYLAVGFMITSLSLAYLTATRGTGGGGATGGSSATRSEVVLPVGNTPVIPEDGAAAGTDSTESDADSIVPGASGDIVPAPADSNAGEGDTDATSGDDGANDQE